MDGSVTPDLPRVLRPGRSRLPRIPVLDVGPSFGFETLAADPDRAHALFDTATRRIPVRALRLLDDVSRRWLTKWDNAHLAEIDAIAAKLGRPGTYFLSVNYEWACTCLVTPSPDGGSARLVRVLDWRTPGLGRNVMAARVAGPVGGYVALTWPGYTGVINGMAPGRFSAALNQAPMRFSAGLMPIDWVMARAKLWQTPHPTAAHVLRAAFDHSVSFRDAKAFLFETPIAAPCIFSLAGVAPDETCVIERTETTARVFVGTAAAANHWQPEPSGSYDWRGRSRGVDSQKRGQLMTDISADLSLDFDTLPWPIINAHTRLVMVADAARGELAAQGYESDGPATEVLSLAA
jgi:hypothetical protein